jgi:hypothetical protein
LLENGIDGLGLLGTCGAERLPQIWKILQISQTTFKIFSNPLFLLKAASVDNSRLLIFTGQSPKAVGAALEFHHAITGGDTFSQQETKNV